MKLAFWRKDSAPEKRQSAPPLSHAYIDAILQQATGSASSNPTGLASLEACAGAYSRAFAAAVVTLSDRPETRALTPSLMALIARDCIRLGESMILITVVDGQVQLIPAGSWDIVEMRIRRLGWCVVTYTGRRVRLVIMSATRAFCISNMPTMPVARIGAHRL